MQTPFFPPQYDCGCFLRNPCAPKVTAVFACKDNVSEQPESIEAQRFQGFF